MWMGMVTPKLPPRVGAFLSTGPESIGRQWTAVTCIGPPRDLSERPRVPYVQWGLALPAAAWANISAHSRARSMEGLLRPLPRGDAAEPMGADHSAADLGMVKGRARFDEALVTEPHSAIRMTRGMGVPLPPCRIPLMKVLLRKRSSGSPRDRSQRRPELCKEGALDYRVGHLPGALPRCAGFGRGLPGSAGQQESDAYPPMGAFGTVRESADPPSFSDTTTTDRGGGPSRKCHIDRRSGLESVDVALQCARTHGCLGVRNDLDAEKHVSNVPAMRSASSGSPRRCLPMRGGPHIS
jgi:hypothetical protein